MGRTIMVLIVIALVALLALWAIDLEVGEEVTSPAISQRAEMDVPEIDLEEERFASPEDTGEQTAGN